MFSTCPDLLRKSVHYDGFLTLYVDIFSVEVLSTNQARIYIYKSAGNAPWLTQFSVDDRAELLLGCVFCDISH